jgi:hypothetical protein
MEEFNLPKDNYNDYFYIKKILNGYRGALINKKKFEILYALARTHETITSYDIFEKSKEKIKMKELNEYIKLTDLKNAPIITEQKN